MTNIVYKTAGEVAEASSVAAGDDFLLSVGGQARRVPRDTIRNFAGIFATTPDLKAATGLTNGSTYSVTVGKNREPETFMYTTSAATADEDVILAATGMGTGYLISRRTTRATVADLVADRRTFATGVNLIAGGYPYITVSASPHLTLAGGQKVQHVAVNNTYHMLALNPNADGVTDDSALIDLLNQSGYMLDLGGKDYGYAGAFTASALITNGQIIDNDRTRDYRPVPRDTIRNFADIFATTADLKAATGLTNGSTYNVTLGYNREPETFVYTTSGATADEDVIIAATGMGTGYLISRRTTRATVADLVADRRTFATGVNLIAGGYPYITVSASPHLTLAGGQKVKHVAVNNTYHMLALNPNADGVTDDSALIDLLNQSGYVLDLGGKDYEYAGTFTASALITNGQITDDDRTRDYRPKTPESQIIATQGRWRVDYHTSTVIKAFGGGRVMLGGFRMFNNYYKMGRAIDTGVNGYALISAADVGDLGAETTRKLENWYAAFAVANENDDTCEFRLMPYLRVQDVTGSVVTLGQAGERKHAPLTTTTYAWAVDALDGVECLIINENAQWSGRVTTITANTTGTVTLTDATGLVEGDFLLPAPPGYTEYAWLCDHYMDTAEWRNIADSGSDVGSYMVNHATFPATGEVASATAYSMMGYISPLASAVILETISTVSTASTGNYTQNIWHDTSTHGIWASYNDKTATTNLAVRYSKIVCQFSKKQEIVYSTGGTLDTSVSGRTLSVRGWVVT